MSGNEQTIERQREFGDTPQDWQRYWTTEFAAADREHDEWKESARISIDAFLDKREGEAKEEFRANFYWANLSTQRALTFGKTPSVNVDRRYRDHKDDEARIAGPLILQRVLNTDIEQGTDGYRRALRNALSDYQLAGLGNARVRYVAEFDEEPIGEKEVAGKKAPGFVKQKKKPGEDVVVDYVNWEDQRWSPCRVIEEMRWWSHRSLMTRDELVDRWGEELGRTVPLSHRALARTNEDAKDDPWSRAEVWEVWSKQHKKVFWFVKGMDRVLEVQDDPYELRGFWPFPEPLIANVTTSKFVPRCDYALAQDIYREINLLSSRIQQLEQGLRVAGVYDIAAGPLEQLLSKPGNVLIPVAGFDRLKEGGGLRGVIEWLPLDQIVNALMALRDQRELQKQLLYEITGWADIQRGQADANETATATRSKVRFGSARLQHTQEEFARFATELQQLRAELMMKFFDEETFLQRANVLFTDDAQAAIGAIQSLKKEFPSYRVEVTSENLAQQDFAAVQQERTQFITALSQLLRDAVPALQPLGPAAIPVVGELIKWTLAGFRGGATIEGVIDRAMEQAQQQAQQQAANPQQDPKLMQQQQKAQLDSQREQMKLQFEGQRQNLKTQGEAKRQEMQLQYNVRETQLQLQAKAQAAQQQAVERSARAAQDLASRPVPGGKK